MLLSSINVKSTFDRNRNKMKTLDIIIVNWNSGDQLFKCLESIQQSEIKSFLLSKVIVIDNHSADDSLKNIEFLNIPIVIIRNDKNRGFGAACNQGAAISNSDYILFLNPDTLLYKDSMNKVIEYMNLIENSDVGVCGIRLVDDKNSIQRSCCEFPTVLDFVYMSTGLSYVNKKLFPTYVMSNWAHNENKAVNHVIGAFYMIRSEVFKEVEGFDEQYFVYLEDLDLSFRVVRKGYKIMYLSDVEAYHKGGGVSEQVKALRLFYSLHSRIKYVNKHFNKLNSSIVFFLTMFIEPISRVILGILKLSLSNINEVYNGYYLLWKELFKSSSI